MPQQPDHNATGPAVTWGRLSHFDSNQQHHAWWRQDAAGVPLHHGKCLLLGGRQSSDDSGSNATRLVDFNARRSFPFPSLQEARLGAVAINWKDEVVIVAGGASSTGQVLKSVESLALDSAEREWQWQCNDEMPVARLYAAAVAVPSKHVIVVVGGRSANYQELDSVDVGVVEEPAALSKPVTTIRWTTLSSKLPAPRMGCAAVLLNETTLLVLGGYDGRTWQRTCYCYDFSPTSIDDGGWSKGVPDMLETVRFVKAVVYYNKYVLVMGERDDSGSSSSSVDGAVIVQCYDSHLREWIWAKTCACPALDVVSLQEPFLYGFSSSGQHSRRDGDGEDDDDINKSNAQNAAGVYVCELSELDPHMVADVIPVAVGTTATADVEAPTIIADNAVLVAEDFTSDGRGSAASQDDPFLGENIKLRHVVRIKLSERSFYTGQLRKKDGTHVPHGQGLLVWVEEDKNGDNHTIASMEAFSPSSPSSYYKGQFLNGFRHGLGEMYLRVEDKHYFGSFEYGSWEGVGSLKIRSRGFSYFGRFSSGEMTGQGRCSYRVKQQNQWKQKTFSGGFIRGLAHGRGVVADYLTGRIETDREFHEEDLFQFGSEVQTSADA